MKSWWKCSNVLYNLNKHRCEGKRIQAPPIEVTQKGFGQESNEEALKYIDQKLKDGIPVGLVYHANFLVDERGPSGHLSTIAGRRFNPQSQKCEYLIRNTWGTTCPVRSEGRCEAGYYWASREELHQHMVGAFSYEK